MISKMCYKDKDTRSSYTLILFAWFNTVFLPGLSFEPQFQAKFHSYLIFYNFDCNWKRHFESFGNVRLDLLDLRTLHQTAQNL